MTRELALKNRSIFQTLSNEHRINILYELYEGPTNWSELMYKYRINSKSLKDHLTHLFERGYVEKPDSGYALTREGRELCEFKFLKDLCSQACS